MSVYLSMQRVRFSSPDAYEKFKVVFSDVRHHLMELPGFMHLTWWEHPDDPTWYNEVSFWASKEALIDWHMNTYHKAAKDGRQAGRSWRTSSPTSSWPAPACCESARPAASSRTFPSTSPRNKPARRTVPAMRIPFPGAGRDADQFRGVQGPRYAVEANGASTVEALAGWNAERLAPRLLRRVRNRRQPAFPANGPASEGRPGSSGQPGPTVPGSAP